MFDHLFAPLPASDLAPPSGGPLPAGQYSTTFDGGADTMSNDRGWTGLRLPFTGFTNRKTGEEFPTRQLTAMITLANANSPRAQEIGQQELLRAAQAFGFAVDDGAGNVSIPASSVDEIVELFNQQAGIQVGVSVSAKPSDRKKDNGDPFINNDIKSIYPLND